MNESKEAEPGEVEAAVAKHASSFSSKVPAAVKTSAVEGLKRGDYDAAAVSSLSGVAAPSGTPEQKATTGAVSQLAAKSYGEVFKDAEGKPLTPFKDTPENRATRLPQVVREASRALASSLETTSAPAQISAPAAITPAAVAMAPTEVPATAPTTGMSLSQAAENQRNFEVAGKGTASGAAATIINNVKNNSSTVNNVQQAMPDARSGESSFLRAQDTAFARY
jgi:hypothetical protein